MKIKGFLFWLLLQSIMILTMFLLIILMIWLGVVIKTGEISSWHTNSISIELKGKILLISALMMLGLDFITRIMKMNFIKKHSSFFGWLTAIVFFGIGLYLSINYGY